MKTLKNIILIGFMGLLGLTGDAALAQTSCGWKLIYGTESSAVLSMFMNTNQNYSIIQRIYTYDELMDIDSLSGIRFEIATDSGTRQMDIYVDTTSRDSYAAANANAFIVQDSSHLVFSGPVTLQPGWVEVLFDHAAATTPGKNIVLTIADNTGASAGVRIGTVGDVAFNTNRLLLGRNNLTPMNPTVTPQGTWNRRTWCNNVEWLHPCGCAASAITDVHVEDHSVTLHWEQGNNYSWEVKYRHSDSTIWNVANASVTDTFYTVTGLWPNMHYQFRVNSLCGYSQKGIISLSRTTLCGPATAVPYFEGFEDTTVSLPTCWSSSPTTNLYIDTLYTHTGVGSLTTYAAAVLPMMTVPVDSLAITFWATNGNGTWRYVDVGVALDPMDESTYTVVETVAVEPIVVDNTPNWQEFTVYLDTYHGPEGRIFIRPFESSTLFLLDDITVDRAEACHKPYSLEVNNVRSNAVIVTAQGGSHDNYTFFWGLSPTTMTDSLTSTDATATIGGLLSDTTYYISVRGNCGTTRTTPTTPREVRTSCGRMVVTADAPWLEDFEHGDLGCMRSVPIGIGRQDWFCTGTSMWGEAYSGGVYNGIYMAALREPNNMDVESMLILPTFDFSALDTDAVLSFYEYNHTNNNLNPGTLYVYSIADTTGEWTLVEAIDSSRATSAGWTKRVVTLPASQGVPVYQVAIKGRTNGTQVGWSCIDYIRVGKPLECSSPANVTVDSVTHRSAVIRWTDCATTHKVQYRPVGSAFWTGISVEGADSCVLVPLEISTEYEVRVTRMCSDFEQSEPSEAVRFITPFCPNVIERSNFTVADTVSYIAPVACLTRNSRTEILIDADSLNGMREIQGIKFQVPHPRPSGVNNNRIAIYMGHVTADTMSGFLGDSNFVQVFNGVKSFTALGEYRIEFDNPFEWDGHSNVVMAIHKYDNGWHNNPPFDSTGFAAHTEPHCMVFSGASNTAFGPSDFGNLLPTECEASNVVPNITLFGCVPFCYKPVVSGVNVTDNRVSVGWYNEGDPVQVELKEASEPWGDSPLTVSHNNRYTFRNLLAATAYDVRLRRVCDASNDDYSDWVTISVTTATDTQCPLPDGLAATEVGATTATLSWEGAGTGYEVHVWNGDGVDLYYEAAASPFTADGLRPNANYRAAVRTFCDGGNTSTWSAPLTFDNICHPATGLTATSHDGNVYLSWEAGAHNQQWIVTYSYAGYDRNQRIGYLTVDTTAAIITGLTPGVSYGFRVVAVCGDGWQGGWTGAEVTATVSTEGIDAVDGNAVYLFPNPATRSVTVGGLNGENTVTVVDMNGRECGKWEVESGAFSIDLSGYARGAYFVRITGERATTVRKLVVK